MGPIAPDHAPRLRLRLPELLAEREMTYLDLAAQSAGRISRSTAHRLTMMSARDSSEPVKLFDSAILAALCDVLAVTPGELFEKPPTARGPVPKRRRPKL